MVSTAKAGGNKAHAVSLEEQYPPEIAAKLRRLAELEKANAPRVYRHVTQKGETMVAVEFPGKRARMAYPAEWLQVLHDDDLRQSILKACAGK